MRKILLVLCILSITISAKAQLFGKSWKEGSYYDLKGTKHIGFVSWTPPQGSFFSAKGDNIYYKKDKKSDEVAIKSPDLIAFTRKIDDETIDSFVVSKNEMFKKAPFLKVVIANDLKLYSSTTITQSSGIPVGIPGETPAARASAIAMSMNRSSGTSMGVGISGGKTSYFFGSDPENITELTRKNFVEIMTQIMANKPEAVARIKNKKLRYRNMYELLYFYKYDMMPPAMAPDPFSGSNN